MLLRVYPLENQRESLSTVLLIGATNDFTYIIFTLGFLTGEKRNARPVIKKKRKEGKS
jgi:hypothetical protein